MSSPTPAGNPERVPAAPIADGDPVESLRRVNLMLPALREAAGDRARVAEALIQSRDWKTCRAVYAADASLAACVLYADALIQAAALRAKIREDADAADRERVAAVALAVARSADRFLPERAEAEIEIEAAAAATALDSPADRRNRLDNIREARGDSENTAPWICLYSLERCDGGPEEGGWSYDWLEPIAAIRTADYSDPRDARFTLERHAEDRGLIIQGRTATADGRPVRPLSSVCSIDRVNAIILPAPYPFADASIERPRYE